MTDKSGNFIIYDVKTKNVKILNQNGKKAIYKSILDDLQKAISNYYDKEINLSEQETFLFNFQESSKLSSDKSLFYSTMHNLIEDIKKSKSYSYSSVQSINIEILKGELKLNYEGICGITNFIIAVLFKELSKNGKSKREKMLFEFTYRNKVPAFKTELKKLTLSQLITRYENVKNINIALSNKDRIKNKLNCIIDINIIQLFCIFFKAFFKNVLTLTLDLNIYEINRYFNKEINPYKINEEEILRVGQIFNNMILGNLIIIQKFGKAESLNFTMYDSYQLELQQLMIQYFAKKINESNEKKRSQQVNNNEQTNYAVNFQNKFLFFQHILPGIGIDYYRFHINFHSLDPLLFSYSNIVLERYVTFSEIEIQFFNFNEVNSRKILINNYYYNKYKNEKENPLSTLENNNNNIYNDNDYRIYYNYINDICENENNNFLLLKNEAILNALFPSFNHNLNCFLTILESKMMDIKITLISLSFNFSSNNDEFTDLSEFNHYNTAIICFLYNFFNLLESYKSKKNSLSSLEIITDDFSDEKEFLIKNIQKKLSENKMKCYSNLNELNITKLYLNIPNFSLILPIQNFPIKVLTELKLENITFNDLDNLVNTIKKTKNLFPKLKLLMIGFNYMMEDFRNNLQILIKDTRFPKLNSFTLSIPNDLSIEDIVELIICIKKNKNDHCKFLLQISNQIISPYIIEIKLPHLKENFKKYFHQRNIITDIKLQNNQFNFEMKMLDSKDINYYLKLIYCFNKIYSRNKMNNVKIKNKQKIFENIFYYIGKFREKNKKFNIEI